MQEKLRICLSDPSRIFTTASGRRLQVLSPGTPNVHEGPDFLDAAMLLDGSVIIGDIEYHRAASEWKSHGHSGDERYADVMLHIVSADDSRLDESFETLVITEGELLATSLPDEKATDIRSQEELQNMALIRLLRKSASAQKAINRYGGLEESAREIYGDFLSGFYSRKRRPAYDTLKLKGILDKLWSSPSFMFLMKITKKEDLSIGDELQSLLKPARDEEGKALRRELVINCLLPLAICLADERTRIELFFWYWSAASLNRYGVLRRKFPDIPQNYIWQQQGMLEYIREYGNKSVLSDIIRQYGFAEVLSFYRIGRSPVIAISEGEA